METKTYTPKYLEKLSKIVNTFYSSATPLPPPTAQVSQLKRTRSIEGGDAHDATPPPLPQISTDLTLQVFTHKSLRRPQEPHRNLADAEQDDNERLSILGATVFDAAVTDILFQRRPHFVLEDIQKLRHPLLHGGIIDNWIVSYRLQDKLRSAPNVVMSKENEKEKHSVFYGYIGAVFLTSGAGTVNEWIRCLLSQETDYQALSIGTTDARAEVVTVPPPKRVKSEAPSPMNPPATPAPALRQQSLPMYHQTARQMQTRVLGRLQDSPQAPPYPSYPSFTMPSQQSFPQRHIRHPPPHVGMLQPVIGPAQTGVPLPPPTANKTNPLSPAQPNLAFLPLFNQRAVQRRVQVGLLLHEMDLKVVLYALKPSTTPACCLIRRGEDFNIIQDRTHNQMANERDLTKNVSMRTFEESGLA